MFHSNKTTVQQLLESYSSSLVSATQLQQQLNICYRASTAAWQLLHRYRSSSATSTGIQNQLSICYFFAKYGDQLPKVLLTSSGRLPICSYQNILNEDSPRQILLWYHSGFNLDWKPLNKVARGLAIMLNVDLQAFQIRFLPTSCKYLGKFFRFLKAYICNVFGNHFHIKQLKL